MSYSNIHLRQTGKKTLYISIIQDDNGAEIYAEHKFEKKNDFEKMKWLIHHLQEFLNEAKK